ncbi:hypothetical protein [Ectobacillus sp. JY-23]|nr:hypothetical protein [Ectobacillus sp. JY-23]
MSQRTQFKLALYTSVLQKLQIISKGEKQDIVKNNVSKPAH